jgi:molybdenum cofactor biosynthesis enzyme MoaA
MKELLATAKEVVKAASEQHLSPAMAAANKGRRFDTRGRTEALRTWIEARRSSIPGFSSLDFLRAYHATDPREPAAAVLLVLEYRARHDRVRAVEIMSATVAQHRYDLYVGEMARSVFAWAEIRPADDVDEWLKGRHCDLPFTNFDTMPNGEVFMCCADWLPVPIGNIHRNTAEEIWHSPVANEIRASITDGSFRFCSRRSCVYIANRDLPERKPALAADGTTSAMPERIVLSHDNSCNLSCPSCRAKLIMARKPEQDAHNALLDTVFVPLLRHAKTVRVTGSGDPFASHHYRTLLKRINREEFPELYIALHTNAQLFDERAWHELALEGKVGHVEISIDAATPETYHVVRRGGDFERLLLNLEFVRQLRACQSIPQLVFSFVVQQLNYREMPAFVQLAERFGADTVDFRMILNWGTFSSEEFKTHNIGDRNHPEYQQYLRILAQPELHKPNVRLPPT